MCRVVNESQRAGLVTKLKIWLTVQSLQLSGRPQVTSPQHLTLCVCGSRSARVKVTGDNRVPTGIVTVTYISGVDHPPTTSSVRLPVFQLPLSPTYHVSATAVRE